MNIRILFTKAQGIINGKNQYVRIFPLTYCSIFRASHLLDLVQTSNTP